MMLKQMLTYSLLLATMLVYGQEYSLDKKSSTVSWTGYGEVGKTSKSGKISLESGHMRIQDGVIHSGKLTIDMKTISHEEKQLEKHLKNEDFFDVKNFPKATFEISSIDGQLVTGNLTLKGITRTITFQLNLESTENSAVLHGEGMIDRTQFEIKYNSSSYFQDLGSYAIKNEFLLSFDVHFILLE